MTTTLVLSTRNLFNAGSFAAIINALASLGVSVAPPITGKIIDAFGGNRTVYYIFLFIVLSASQIDKKNKGFKKIYFNRLNV